MEAALSDLQIKKEYIAFRSNPANVKITDQGFCEKQGIAVARLQHIKEIDAGIDITIASREVTDGELSMFLGLLTRLLYEKAFTEKIPVKSLEGLANALVNLMKQRSLETGKPTEIFKIKIDELKKKTPQELNQHLLGLIRHGDRN